MTRINQLLITASQTGTYNLENHRAMMSEIQQYFDQIKHSLNQNYLGRYVFSGFHTDEPPTLKLPLSSSFVIQQTFNISDIERTLALHRREPMALPDSLNVNILKLPFTNVNFGVGENFGAAGDEVMIGSIPDLGIFMPDGTRFTIYKFDSVDYEAFRNLPDDTAPPVVHFIRDTGEIVMSDAVRDIFENGVVVRYYKDEFAVGELNPRINFPSWEINGIAGNDYRHFNVAQQNIQMEVAVGQFITTNSHASNILTDKMFADLQRLIDFGNGLVGTPENVVREYFMREHGYNEGDALNHAVSTFLSQEETLNVTAWHNRVNNMIERHHDHMQQAQREHTNLGSRMARLDMIAVRLEEDTVAYSSLLADNEDTQMYDAIKRRDAAEAAFQAALRAIAMINQMSLADFINR
jgi:flagellin-like hook-associated protein FlgL